MEFVMDSLLLASLDPFPCVVFIIAIEAFDVHVGGDFIHHIGHIFHPAGHADDGDAVEIIPIVDAKGEVLPKGGGVKAFITAHIDIAADLVVNL